MPTNENNPFKMTNEDGDIYEMFHGEPKPLHPDTRYETFTQPTAKENPAKAVKAPAIEPKVEPATVKEANWEPVPHEPTQIEIVKACAKGVALFGGLNLLIFYWQQAGLMASSIAIPSMCVCAALAGLSVGKNIAGGKR